MVIAWVKALETCRAATFLGLHAEEGEGVCKKHVCLFVCACISLYKAADGNVRVFKSQGTKKQVRLFKALLEHSRPSDSKDVRQ